ncbi:major facilitator superfamily domain-containing protein [Penicillium manginii]|uniref:major facilitator superfamily domain-containing protein n=1 Tax=Penicillium manginii TaxID=203109 RepID=UPI00254771D8|nr:major facilitator superfamily domain-containing protein [Penicillium manginii]KAJ5750622.1 major facilitator superfamily domain-containing protein [Penicillium manginii]
MDNPSSSPHLDGAKPPSNPADSTPIPKDDELHSQRVLAKVDRERTETDSIISDDAAGVKKAEAVVLAWDKNAVWAVYAWIWVCFFMLAFHSSIQSNVIVYAYANFKTAPEIPTSAILGSVVGGVVKLPVAKIVNIWGRAEALVVFTCLFLLGIIVLASCTGPSGYAAGYVLYYVGYNAIYLILDVFIADTSGLRNRAFAFAFSSTPFICTAFTGPLAAQALLKMTSWRWAYGIFAIVFPFVLLPLAVVFKFYERKAEKMGLYQKTKSDRTWAQSLLHYVHEFDVIGGLLLMAAFILLLLPFSLSAYGRAQYSSASFIAMLVIGFCLLFVFAAWEKFFARKQFIRYDLLKQRTVLGACILSTLLNFGYMAWDSYFVNFAMVVYDLSVSNSGYMNQIYNIGSCFWAPLFGLYIRQTKHFKKACLFFGLPLMLLGSGLMVHFRGQDDGIGYVVMCQIFIAFAGGTLVIGQDMAVMSAADHDGVPMMLSILGLFASLGGAAGATLASAVYTNVFPKTLLANLPESAKADWADIYIGGYPVQMAYPIGSEIRNAINNAWGDSQKYSCIATTAVVALGFPCIAIWKNVNVDKKQVPGTVF